MRSHLSDHSSDDLQPNLCLDRVTGGRGTSTMWGGSCPVPRSGEENTGVCRLQQLFTRTITEQQTMGFSLTEYTGNECVRKGVRTRNAFITVKSEGWRKVYNEQNKYTRVNNCSWTPPAATPPCTSNVSHIQWWPRAKTISWTFQKRYQKSEKLQDGVCFRSSHTTYTIIWK